LKPSVNLPAHEAAIALAFVVVGLVLIIVRAVIEGRRGKRSRMEWLLAGGLFGPLFAVSAFASLVAPRAAITLGAFMVLVDVGLIPPLLLLTIFALTRRRLVHAAVFGGISAVLIAGVKLVPLIGESLRRVNPNQPRTPLTVPHVDTTVSAFALLCVALFVVAVLAAILPWLLDRLEGRTFVTLVATRHVRSQKSGFLTVVSVLSICAVAMSSCALSSTVSIMGGFSQDLKRKILGNNAHIVIDQTSQKPWADYEDVLSKVRAVPGVVGATPVVNGEVMVSSASNIAGVLVRGIEPSTFGNVVDIPNNIEVGKMDYLEHPEKLSNLGPDEVIGIGPGGEEFTKGPDNFGLDLPSDLDEKTKHAILPPIRPGIIVGRELAKTLHVYVGDEVTLVSPLGDLGPMGVMPRTKKFRIAAIFYSGMYEYDANNVYIMKDIAQGYFETGDAISAVEVKVDDAENADRLTQPVVSAIGRGDLRVRDWREMYKNLFSALKLERFATFIILSIAIMVASFCIISTLLLMITEKAKEIAILKAIGARDTSILRTFILEGVIIGGIGTVFGVATAFVLCTDLNWFGLRLDPDVYYIDRLPINVSGFDFLLVTLAALTICTLATIFPAYGASQLRPVDGLRYE
jgi:lipoprotein-releasing system permease protein